MNTVTCEKTTSVSHWTLFLNSSSANKKKGGGKEHFPLLQKASGHFRWTQKRSKDQTCAHNQKSSLCHASSLPVQHTHHTRLWGQLSLWFLYQSLNQFSQFWFALKESRKPHPYHYWHQTVTRTPAPALIRHRDYSFLPKKPQHSTLGSADVLAHKTCNSKWP